jgi:hypothetical protein
MSEDDKQWQNWRQVLKVHPAANKMPNASASEMRRIRGDIKVHGLKTPVILASIAGGPTMLLDGRTRLDALEAEGVKLFDEYGHLAVDHELAELQDDTAAWDMVWSKNVHRRQLDHKQITEAVKVILAERPEASNRSIAKEIGCNHHKVASIRQQHEAETSSAGGRNSHLPLATGAADQPASGSQNAPPAAGEQPAVVVEQATAEPVAVATAPESAPPAPVKRTGADGKSYTVRPKAPKPKNAPTIQVADPPKPEPVSPIVAEIMATATAGAATHPDPAIGGNAIIQAWREADEGERVAFTMQFGEDVVRDHPEPFAIAQAAIERLSAAECEKLADAATARAVKLMDAEKAMAAADMSTQAA